MKVLMIANSFGVNVQTYAADIAKTNGLDFDIYVLYIGGCSLETHTINIKNNSKEYELFRNGQTTKEFISIEDALRMNKWDYVSLQQASMVSGYIKEYHPYFEFVYDFVRKLCPFTKIIFHKTWAYSPSNNHMYKYLKGTSNYFDFKSFDEMNKAIGACVKEVCSTRHIDIVIDSGKIVEDALKKNFDVYDEYGFHMNSVGCYFVGTNLVSNLFKTKIKQVYVPPEIERNVCERISAVVNKNNSF